MSSPSSVTIGVIALRTPWRQITRARGGLWRALYGCSPRTSRRSARAQVSRVDRRRRRGEDEPRQDQGLGPAGERLGVAVAADAREDGTRPTSWANRYSATSPSQKTGAEMNARLVTIVVRSSSDLRLTAQMIPTGIPIASQITTAPVTRKTVAGRRSRMISCTGLLSWKLLAEVEGQDDALLLVHIVVKTWPCS